MGLIQTGARRTRQHNAVRQRSASLPRGQRTRCASPESRDQRAPHWLHDDVRVEGMAQHGRVALQDAGYLPCRWGFIKRMHVVLNAKHVA